jgi:hypothetical protein
MGKRRRAMRDHKKYLARLFREDGMAIRKPGLPTAAHVLVQVVHEGLWQVLMSLSRRAWPSGPTALRSAEGRGRGRCGPSTRYL